MRKTVFWIIGIIAVIVVLTKSSDIIDLLDTIQHGALIPLLLAVVFQAGRYALQSVSLASAFDAVGEEAEWNKMVPMVISGVFINTIAPTGGTAGLVLVVDDARKRNISAGKATSAAMVNQMGNYSGFIIIMIVGFIILGLTGRLDPIAFICGMVLVVAVAFFAGILFICRKNTELLIALFTKVEKFIEKACIKIRLKVPAPWAEKMVLQFSEASTAIAQNPLSLLSVLGYSALGSGLEMLCFICVGFAFGVEAVNELIAAYVVTNIFTIVSPAPNGVGFAEAAATITLTSYGTPMGISTAVALVFRGFVFWIPFAIGALLLRRTGFFDEKKNETHEEKARQTGYIAGLFVCVFGLLNIFFALLPSVPKNYQLLSEWFSIGKMFSPTIAVVLAIMLTLMTRGMLKRSRITWAWTMALLVFLAAAQLLSGGSYYVVILILALAIWLFIKRRDFDRLQIHEGRKHTVIPLVWALGMNVIYAAMGYVLLGSDYFGFKNGLPDALLAALQTFVPGLGAPQPLASYGAWFVLSIYEVCAVTSLWAVMTIVFPWMRRNRYVRKGIVELTDEGLRSISEVYGENEKVAPYEDATDKNNNEDGDVS